MKNKGIKVNNYPAALSINSLRLSVHLGVGEGEREKPQAIELDIRLYFPEAPPSMTDDRDPHFLCYDELCQKIFNRVKGDQFRLIEYLTMQFYSIIRRHLEDKVGKALADRMRIWIRLCKCNAPVPYMLGGASFIYTDLEQSIVEAN